MTMNAMKPRLTLKKNTDTQEWMVVWYDGNKRDESKTYYTDDKEDAMATMATMQKQIDSQDIKQDPKTITASVVSKALFSLCGLRTAGKRINSGRTIFQARKIMPLNQWGEDCISSFCGSLINRLRDSGLEIEVIDMADKTGAGCYRILSVNFIILTCK